MRMRWLEVGSVKHTRDVSEDVEDDCFMADGCEGSIVPKPVRDGVGGRLISCSVKLRGETRVFSR